MFRRTVVHDFSAKSLKNTCEGVFQKWDLPTMFFKDFAELVRIPM